MEGKKHAYLIFISFVRNKISKKTNYLIYGSHVEAQKFSFNMKITETSKYKDAEKLNIPKLSEEDFEELFFNCKIYCHYNF